MTTSLLKRVLPFTLTFILGAAVAGLAGLLTRGGVTVFERHQYSHGGKRGGCGSAYRHKLLAESKPLSIGYQPTAVYTREARRRDYAGTVRMRVTFGADGAVKAVETLQGQPYGLTQSAERAAWKTGFTPAMENGLPISVTRVVEYDFPSEQTVDEY
ncbi:MAG TPA: energy transducer TonB [Pyrinomonadaceae bacterium]|jgi:TonB family protein|nr:energy transducer TonB [Pyrinomonadaceae bacterium]